MVNVKHSQDIEFLSLGDVGFFSHKSEALN